jgi:flagellar export protein FliJ
MSRLFRLSAVLRARQLQEDAAKAEVARARGAARSARQSIGDREAALRDSEEPPNGTGRAVVAAIAARQSLAAGLFAARDGVVAADEVTAGRMAELAEAAKRRRILEKLAERHATLRRAAEQAADQRALDELASTDGQRSALRGDG